ncbi:MAG: hypothetical protein CL678_04260 [Bdellovibrionaceae bacterium]|nr:hypothetical protein [Pseudobdellovibrionaceae bacterium]|tara:strand:+ start:86 stop:505 length:420 start_codon:yes stop_codon:yes gene_type:complete
MKTNQIISTLGCLTLIILAIYFVTGLLKIGGDGLSTLGSKYDLNMIEGFANKDVAIKNTQNLIKDIKRKLSTAEETFDVDDYDDIAIEGLELAKYKLRYEIMKAGLTEGRNIDKAQLKKMVENYKLADDILKIVKDNDK